MPGTTGTPNADTAAFAAILSPMVWIAATGGPMNAMPAASQRGGEFGVLREESVAGVDGLRAGAARRVDDRVDAQVALPCRRGPDADRGVGLGDVPGVGVGVAEDRDRADSHGPQGADDPHGDLAAVGDQDGVDTESYVMPLTSGTRRRRPARAAPVRTTESASPRTVLVSAGSMTPSSHSRAVE